MAVVATPNIKQAIRSAGGPKPGQPYQGLFVKRKGVHTGRLFYGAFHLVAGVIKLVFLL